MTDKYRLIVSVWFSSSFPKDLVTKVETWGFQSSVGFRIWELGCGFVADSLNFTFLALAGQHSDPGQMAFVASRYKKANTRHSIMTHWMNTYHQTSFLSKIPAMNMAKSGDSCN